MAMNLNEARAARAAVTLRDLDLSGDGQRTALVDLLTDAIHWKGLDWVETALRMAKYHAEAEEASRG